MTKTPETAISVGVTVESGIVFVTLNVAAETCAIKVTLSSDMARSYARLLLSAADDIDKVKKTNEET